MRRDPTVQYVFRVLTPDVVSLLLSLSLSLSLHLAEAQFVMCSVVQLSWFGGIIIQSQVITARFVEGTIQSVGNNMTKKMMFAII